MAELRINLNSTTPSGVGVNEIVLYPTNNNGGELNVIGPDGQPKRLLTDLTTLNNITVSGALSKTGTATVPNISLAPASITQDGAMSKFDKQLLEQATEDNIENSLVKRDNEGNFTAEVITASLFSGPSSSTQLIPALSGAITSNGTTNTTTLSPNVINNSNINVGAGIELSKLAVNPLDRVNHTGSQTYTTISNFNVGVSAYLDNNKITNQQISSTAGILISQLAVDPLNRSNHTGPNPASDLDNLDVEVGPIINNYLTNNPVNNLQLADSSVSLTKLSFNPLDRTTHTGLMPAASISNFNERVYQGLSGVNAVAFNNTNGEFSLNLDSNSLKYTASGLGVSDTYVAAVANGGTGKTNKTEAAQNLQSITTLTTNTTLSASHQHLVVITTSGDIDLTLPNANGAIVKYFIKKGSADNLLRVLCNGSDTIEDNPIITLSNKYDYVVIQNDGNNLWVVWNEKGLTVPT